MSITVEDWLDQLAAMPEHKELLTSRSQLEKMRWSVRRKSAEYRRYNELVKIIRAKTEC